MGTCGCLTLIRRQSNEVIPVPLQKSHTAVNSALLDKHVEASELVLPIPFIWWVRLWQGADLLFNILGGDPFGVSGTCLLKFWVLNKMFSFVLMGSPEGTTPHFTLTQHFPPSTSTRMSAATTLCACEVWGCFNQRKAELGRTPKPQSSRQSWMGSSQTLGSHCHNPNKNDGQPPRTWRNKLIILACYMMFLGCYHNSTVPSLNSTEHMGILFLAHHSLPHTHLSPWESSIWTHYVGGGKSWIGWMSILSDPWGSGDISYTLELWLGWVSMWSLLLEHCHISFSRRQKTRSYRRTLLAKGSPKMLWASHWAGAGAALSRNMRTWV